MAFVTGLLLIDAPASALNNVGLLEGERDQNKVGVKLIVAREGRFPYVSAQAFRYWLRRTLESSDVGWNASPVEREKKIAFTAADPLEWHDDDLFGYMRAPSRKGSGRGKRAEDGGEKDALASPKTLTRVSPFRVSTLVSIAPATPTDDFGVMSRGEGDPVPHEHQFYRTTLKGLFSLDLHAAGTFSYRDRTGFLNLDEDGVNRALANHLEHLESEKCYRLPLAERVQRISALFEGLARLEGGAKQTLHYTDVAPAVVVMAVTKGGNHIFNHVIGANGRGLPELKTEALDEVLRVFADEVLSPVYVGWVRGYRDEEREKLEAFASQSTGVPIRIAHPREAFADLVEALRSPQGAKWLD